MYMKITNKTMLTDIIYSMINLYLHICVCNYDSMCIEWKGRAFNLTTEEGIFVGEEVGFAVGFFEGAWMKH